MRLVDLLPSFALEMEALLTKAGESELAAQVPELAIVDRCRCKDDFCGSFYTQPKPKGSYGFNLRNVELEPERGMVILDVVDERIMQGEVLFRDEIRDVVRAAIA